MRNGVRLAVMLGAVLTALLVVACTGRGGGGGAGGLTIVAKRGAFEFVPANVTVAANTTVTIVLQNPDSQIHDWTIDDVPGIGRIHLVADPGKTVSGRFTFTQPGTYRIYCSQPGHTEAGMVGQLTVR